MIALVAVFVVVPFEVGFVESPEVPDPIDPLWIFNRVIDFLVCCHAALCHTAQGLPKGSMAEAGLLPRGTL